MSSRGWIGVDLDGTLAHYEGWKGATHIGDAVPRMLERVKDWIDKGHQVKIFTARANDPISIPYIKLWLEQNGLPELEITATKDFAMIVLWDDRCVQVVPNTGELATEIIQPGDSK
jgi:hydroxymethylpyrimidine pyrophosphatase-like HAD family hydrolase